jgi:hypothetical protein
VPLPLAVLLLSSWAKRKAQAEGPAFRLYHCPLFAVIRSAAKESLAVPALIFVCFHSASSVKIRGQFSSRARSKNKFQNRGKKSSHAIAVIRIA